MIIIDRQNDLGKWYFSVVGGDYYPGLWSFIGLEKNGEIVAVAGYNEYLHNSIRGHIAIKGQITRAFLRAIFDYPFNQLKVKKLVGLVSGNNKKALRFNKHLGFIEEAVITDIFNDGDLHFLTMTREQCRFIK